MSLPPEIRLNIYKRVLIKERCVDFGRRRNFARSSSLLSANKTIATEGAEVLYSMNKFVLRPCRDKVRLATLQSYLPHHWSLTR